MLSGDAQSRKRVRCSVSGLIYSSHPLQLLQVHQRYQPTNTFTCTKSDKFLINIPVSVLCKLFVFSIKHQLRRSLSSGHAGSLRLSRWHLENQTSCNDFFGFLSSLIVTRRWLRSMSGHQLIKPLRVERHRSLCDCPPPKLFLTV